MNPRGITCAALVAASMVAGCGSSAGTRSATTHVAAARASTGSAPPTTAAPAPPTTAAPAPPTTAAPATSATLTKAGANLHVGQTAKVGFNTTLKNGQDGPTYTLAITVTSITPGTMADFNGVSLTGVPKGSLPTYVTLRMANVGSRTLKTSDQDPAYAVGAVNGNDLDSALILTGDFRKCPQVPTPTVFAPGQRFTTCQIFFERGKVTQVGYNGSEATIDQPITWSR